jgi:hypothetical protein
MPSLYAERLGLAMLIVYQGNQAIDDYSNFADEQAMF